MSVKDVLQSLVDDNMVDSERVGTSNYYWAFPSKALHARKNKLEDLENQVKTLGVKKQPYISKAADVIKQNRMDEEHLALYRTETVMYGIARDDDRFFHQNKFSICG